MAVRRVCPQRLSAPSARGQQFGWCVHARRKGLSVAGGCSRCAGKDEGRCKVVRACCAVTCRESRSQHGANGGSGDCADGRRMPVYQHSERSATRVVDVDIVVNVEASRRLWARWGERGGAGGAQQQRTAGAEGYAHRVAESRRQVDGIRLKRIHDPSFSSPDLEHDNGSTLIGAPPLTLIVLTQASSWRWHAGRRCLQERNKAHPSPDLHTHETVAAKAAAATAAAAEVLSECLEDLPHVHRWEQSGASVGRLRQLGSGTASGRRLGRGCLSCASIMASGGAPPVAERCRQRSPRAPTTRKQLTA